MSITRTRLRRIAVLSTVVLLSGIVAVPGARAEPANIAASSDTAEPYWSETERESLVRIWRSGGPQVQAAAEAALLGSDAEVAQFMATTLPSRQKIDERLAVNRMRSAGGESIRAAGQAALDSSSPSALQEFLASGWESPSRIDQRVRVNQMMASAGTQLKKAAQAALDADGALAQAVPTVQQDTLEENGQATGPLDVFLSSGWKGPMYADLRLRVNQIKMAGGPQVRTAAQRALDIDDMTALASFIDSGWAVAAARDQEVSTLTDLANAAKAAQQEATSQTTTAKEESAKAVTAATAAKQAALDAAAAVESSKNNAKQAAVSVKQAAAAAKGAAKAARRAVAASQAAVAAARQASAAAARASAAAAMTQKAATRAQQAAANAANEAGKAAEAKDAAKAATDAAKAADTAADAADSAFEVAKQTGNAILAAGNANVEAGKAVTEAENALAQAEAAGVNVAEARAAAAQARANAGRAREAADAAVAFSNATASAAAKARDAARRAAADARAAATAANKAAEAAGDAAQAAQLSTAAANAATVAANDAVAAATEAKQVYDAARAVDQKRLKISFEEGMEAAQAELAASEAYEKKVDWDAQEIAKRDAATNELIADVRDQATEPQAAVTAARQVAMDLVMTGGPWTRQAALEALGDTDDGVVEFVRVGIDVAARQDDRATVSSLASTGSEAMAAAAEAALDGTDAEVVAFLKSQNYPERFAEDRLAVNQVLEAASTAGNPVTAQRAQTALDAGTGAALRTFLDEGQFVAQEIDERLKANQVLSDPESGPQLKAAAQIALEGTAAALHQFVTVEQYRAAQNDMDAAAHDAEVSALLSQAIAAATAATQQAEEAHRVAAIARGAQDEAAAWATRAQQSKQQAATYAGQAIASADKAQTYAEKAAASARTAEKAAKKANQAARKAETSAARAEAAYHQAVGYSQDALAAADEAKNSAIAAGKDAATALQYYREAYAAFAEKDAKERRKADNTAQAFICAEQYSILGPLAVEDCKRHVTDTEEEKTLKAVSRSQYCQSRFPEGSNVYKNCVANSFNPNWDLELGLDVATATAAMSQTVSEYQLFVMGAGASLVLCTAACGFIAGMAGSTAGVMMGVDGVAMLAGVEALVSMGMLEYGSVLAMNAAFLNALRRAGMAERSMISLEANISWMARGSQLAKQCLTGNSFAAGTEVLLDGGERKPIEDVVVGDKVVATDPGAGATSAERVTQVHRNYDTDLVDVTVTNAAGDREVLETTRRHPFWNNSAGRWTDAAELRAGDQLRSDDGDLVPVVDVRLHTATRLMFNLSVAELHTFYVSPGDIDVLVHNANPPCKELLNELTGNTDDIVKHNALIQARWEHVFDRHAHEWWGISQEAMKPQKQRYMADFQELVRYAARSKLSGFFSTSKCKLCTLHMAKVDGRWVAVRFYAEGDKMGYLYTVVFPRGKQLRDMLRAVGAQ